MKSYDELLVKYLADYIEHEQEKHPRESGLVDLQEIIQQGIEAFESTEQVEIEFLDIAN